ncbi:MAG: hypothetical protein HYV07_10980 [Deltaproteobacteria bacterium]|nr:hypothetical protein [Deltaproteobacteria bacterium]
MATKPGYQIQFRSRKDLDEDVRTYLSHGGVMVPWLAKLPEVNTDVAIRIVTTFDEACFLFNARVIQQIPGTGFMATFDDKAAKKAIQDHVVAPAFGAGLATQPGRPGSRLATPFEVEIEAPKARFEVPKRPSLIPEAAPPAIESEPAFSDLSSLEDDATTPALTPMDEDLGLSLPDEDEPKAAPQAAAEAPPSPDAAIDDGEESDVANEDEYFAVAAASDAAPDEEEEKPTFGHPPPGAKFIVYVVKFASVLDFVEQTADFRTSRSLGIDVEEAAAGGRPAAVGDVVHLRLHLPGRNIFQTFAEVISVEPKRVTVRVNPGDPEHEKACAFPKTLTGKKRLAAEKPSDRGPNEILRFLDQRSAEEEANAGPIRVRLKRMSMEDKINLALSGGREERMALAMDTNKAIPHYVLRNAKITLDEIAFISRLPSMNPDVLNKIAENTTYVQNSQVVKNLVFNPKTPITTAVRLLDRLAKNELMMLAKRTSMNQRLVQAAKKKVGIK